MVLENTGRVRIVVIGSGYLMTIVKYQIKKEYFNAIETIKSA